MNRFQALFIMLLSRKGLSFRDIASKWTERYELKLPYSDTIKVSGTTRHGEFLCENAVEYLNI